MSAEQSLHGGAVSAWLFKCMSLRYLVPGIWCSGVTKRCDVKAHRGNQELEHETPKGTHRCSGRVAGMQVTAWLSLRAVNACI